MGISQRSFASGEIAPALYARTDQSKYASALRTCRNFMVMRHGGLVNRPGTEFIGEVKIPAKTVRLIPFIFSTAQTYVLEFGDEYMRVIKNGAYVTLTAQNIAGISNAATAVLTYDGADTYANGDEVYISGVVGAMAPYVNGRTFKVANVTVGSNTFELNYLDDTAVVSTSWGSYTSGGTIAEIYTVVSPYDYLDLPNLRFVQSADVITIVHPSYAPRELSRTGDAAWAFTTITFGSSIGEVQNVAADGSGIGSNYNWGVTAITVDGEEGVDIGTSSTGDVDTDVEINWDALSGAASYNIYKKFKSGPWGLIGSTTAIQFFDKDINPDYESQPPIEKAVFASSNNYPSCVAYHQQRIVYANSNNDPEKFWASRIGLFKNFNVYLISQDDDGVQFTLSGKLVNNIKHLLNIGKLLVFTSNNENSIEGNASGVLTPSAINPKQFSGNGCSDLAPLVVNNTVIYNQARGSIIRDLIFDFNVDGYNGNDLTIWSAHLFDKYTISDWAYQQIPHSIVWVVRDDGALLGLTYVREQQLFAWHRHDFGDDEVENVCVVPEGNEDVVYLVIKRTIGTATKRYVERFNTRQISDIEDAVFVDSSLSYDGTNSGVTTMTLSGGTLWTATELLTLTASVAATFAATDIGNRIDLTGSDGEIIRFTISSYTSGTVVKGFAHKTVPATLQATATAVWSKCVDELTGLWHLEGKEVSVFADGAVVGNPNNASIATTYTVTSGAITLDKPYSVIHVGLPIIADIETLDIDTAEGISIVDKKKIVTKVDMRVNETRGIWVGAKPPTDDDDDPLEGLIEMKVRSQDDYDVMDLKEGVIDVNIQSQWNSNGRIFIRQVDPVPCSILSIVPSGLIPYPRG